ncbi:LuxR C-terminal-related transcriptional regulator [Amycolatopsis sp., V23-08]|uniref:LuxR C-terminal-related transcriptional regulator n=1 Tax=Amycolatopsis heterodermiae TaxID=3110235 RepID=A0ABU5RE26_9PSEU|nr:LuxR C-terminal-related transcriptional regulator [Amycolatopsis sp., V23-08]MEA5363834.1 LuxR C-terminal-related transcriptional regulator [Amycolatopsis sp., V23-08]
MGDTHRLAKLVNDGVARAEAIRLASSEGGWYAVLALMYAGEIGRATAECARVPDRAVTVLRARLAWLTGAPAEAAALLREVRDPRLRGLAVAWLVAAMTDLADLEDARTLLLDHGFGGALADVPDAPELLAARGDLHFAAGRFVLARNDFRECGRLLTALGVANPAVIPWRSRQAVCESVLGRAEVGAALAAQDFAAARRWGSARALGIATHAVATTSGRDPALLRTAEALLRHGDRLRCRYDLALALDESGDRAAARALLSDVGRSAREAGYFLMAAEASAASGRLCALTQRERKIAGLARAGWTNRRIAQREAVTLRTVEFHLTSVYRKLGVGGRHELVALPGFPR